MSNILTKPYTDNDYAEFAVIANSNGQRTEQDDNAVYALYDYEELQNGQIVNVSDTETYQAKVLAKQNAIRKADLTAQINELDLKRIRAGFEPSVKDESTGQTYLEYYTAQIQDLRTQISSL